MNGDFHPPHEERARFTTKDRLNWEQGQSFTLQSLILAEIFLVGGPCDIYRLWSKMYERKSITVGTLLFTRAIVEMEDAGLLKQVEINKTAITKKGEIHLWGILLLGLMPKEALWKLEAKGILDVAPQGTAGVSGGKERNPSGDGNVCGVRFPGAHNKAADSKVSDVAAEVSAPPGGIREKEGGACAECMAGGGVAPPSSPLRKFAGEGGLPQGTAKCEAVTSLTSPAIKFPADDRFADNIARAVDFYLDACDLAEQERLEELEAEREGLMTEMSGYPRVGESRY